MTSPAKKAPATAAVRLTGPVGNTRLTRPASTTHQTTIEAVAYASGSNAPSSSAAATTAAATKPPPACLLIVELIRRRGPRPR